MSSHWDTEILTTCALDYMTWENFYPEGVEQLGPTMARRFPIDQPRDVEAFNRLSAQLHSRQREATLAEQEEWMRAQGPISTPLLNYLSAHKTSYDAFIFFGYLYATTYFGLPLVRSRAFLEPLGHDEWTIYFSMWDRFFRLPRSFIFNSAPEHDFLRKRFPYNFLSGPVIGVGIENPGNVDAGRFKVRYGLTSPYLLYVGRVDESKGCPDLFEYFIRWKRERGSAHKLVVIGREVMPVPFHDDIVYLGFVEETQRWAAMKGCDWLVMPSRHESLSMVLLEAWSVGRPGLVNAASAVLVRHCQESNGGIWYEDYNEWCAALATIDADQKVTLGRQGQAYVRQRYSWDRVEDSYRELLAQSLPIECQT
jgi:glycosyltransferase involved in cell wall biosynthesis